MDFQLTMEQKILRDSVRKLAKDKFAEKAFTWDKEDKYPWENAKILGKIPIRCCDSLVKADMRRKKSTGTLWKKALAWDQIRR